MFDEEEHDTPNNVRRLMNHREELYEKVKEARRLSNQGTIRYPERLNWWDQDHPEQYIWNIRMNYVRLSYLGIHILHKRKNLTIIFNRFVVGCFLVARQVRLSALTRIRGILHLKN